MENGDGGLLRRGGLQRIKKRIGSYLYKHQGVEGALYIIPYVIVWAAFLAYPVGYGIYLSLFKWKGLQGSTFVGLSNYAELFEDPRFWNAFFNTLKFSAMVIPMIILFGLLFALMLWGWGKSRKGALFVQASLFFPYLLTVSIIALVWRWLLDTDYGIALYALKSLGISCPNFLSEPAWVLPALTFVTAWWLAGYRMVVFQAGLEDIPRELFEAAKIDGTGPWGQFSHIILPLLKPALLFTLITTIIAGFRTFGQVLMMTEGGPGHFSEVLALYLYRVGFDYFQIGKAAASGIVLLLLVLLVTLIGVRIIGLKSELQ